MSTRVTDMSMQTAAWRNLQTHMGKMAKFQDQMTTGRAFTKPSEDPTSTVTSMRVRSDQRLNAQFERNIRDGITWTSSVDTAIQNSSALLTNVRDLTVQGANTGVHGPASLRAIAAEIRGISDALLQQANATVAGRSIFAGTSDAEAAFQADAQGTVTYTGVADQGVTRRLSEATQVRVDADGAAVFGDGPAGSADESVFAMLGRLANVLEGKNADGSPLPAGAQVDGTKVAEFLQRIDSRQTAMVNQLALVGTRHNQLLRAEADIATTAVDLEAQRSSVEDIDLAEATIKLSLQEVTYQASLSATARSLQPSLMDFLR